MPVLRDNGEVIVYLLLESAFVMAMALCLDRLLGEPKRAHPLIAFGRWVSYVEAALYPAKNTGMCCILYGTTAWFLAVVPLCVLCVSVYYFLPDFVQLPVSIFVLYLVIAPKSLAEHASAVEIPLLEGKLDEARKAVSMLVSRDTDAMKEEDIAVATIESVIENAHDAVIAPLFWFVILGLPGAIFFRLSNTLDAMWGYKNERYLYFGRFAARIDDVAGYLSARITVVLYSLFSPRALIAARRDGKKWESPNAGPVMAAGATCLKIKLGGDAIYHGKSKRRPTLGEGDKPKAKDIKRAIAMTERSYWIWVIIVGVLGVITVLPITDKFLSI